MSIAGSLGEPKIEVLVDVEVVVADLIRAHESHRTLWLPSQLLPPAAEEDAGAAKARLRALAAGISPPVRAALALNLLTEEGLPHFHRILSSHISPGASWSRWRNLWTAEEDRHGTVLRDYVRDSLVFDTLALERLQFDYICAGHEVAWEEDPYRVFVYTTLQERATQVSHANTGRLAGECEPTLAAILTRIAQDEARHYSFYRSVFKEILARDPNGALESAAKVMPGLEMPGVNIPQFAEFADVVRRAEIYGPRDYRRILEEQICFWNIAGQRGLAPGGRRAQEKILSLPARLERLAECLEARSRPKTFSFEVLHGREFRMN
jgi:acyl-[acyl-carrier-protein] desaturase